MKMTDEQFTTLVELIQATSAREVLSKPYMPSLGQQQTASEHMASVERTARELLVDTPAAAALDIPLVDGQEVLTPPEALRLMLALRKIDIEPEDAHIDADRILCAVLRGYGQHELVDIFLTLPRWYA